MNCTPATLDPDACYLALRARDARFDGCFFTGVASTGIYCRPVCGVRTPKRENCSFYNHAAQAERAGFRPCLRCRPELAPRSRDPQGAQGATGALHAWSTQDASATLAWQAARLLDDPAACGNAGESERPMAELARRLGVSDRHVRRIFESRFGVSPMQYLQTRRLLTAKQLLADTDLPVTRIALMSGFASVRRFNAAFAGHYGLNPTQLRRQGTSAAGQGIQVKLGFRPPYDASALLEFFARRQLTGVEHVTTDGAWPAYARTLQLDGAGRSHRGTVQVRFDLARHQLRLEVSDSLREVLPQVIERTREAFDVDALPQAIDAALGAEFPGGDGLRVPGTLDGFELAVRAVLGQQISVAAARTLGQRLVERFGESLETGHTDLNRLFPTPAVFALATGDALGQLGIVKQRQAAILALAQAVRGGSLVLQGGSDVQQTIAHLKSLPGIGDWTAQYIAMRALRWPDAFPAGDVALHHALGLVRGPTAGRQAAAASVSWQPWRSYAVIRAWQGHYRPPLRDQPAPDSSSRAAASRPLPIRNVSRAPAAHAPSASNPGGAP